MAQAQNLFGSDLAKFVHQTEEHSRLKQKTGKWTETGNVMLLEDVEELPRFKKRPEQLEALKENSPPFKCRITGAMMIEVPEYQSRKEELDCTSRVSKRTVSAESKIKAAKRPKPNVDPDNAGDEKALDEKQKKRLEKTKESLDKAQLDLSTQLAVAKAPDNAGDVPAKLIAKAEAADAELVRISLVVAGIIAKDKAGKVVGQTKTQTLYVIIFPLLGNGKQKKTTQVAGKKMLAFLARACSRRLSPRRRTPPRTRTTSPRKSKEGTQMPS